MRVVDEFPSAALPFTGRLRPFTSIALVQQLRSRHPESVQVHHPSENCAIRPAGRAKLWLGFSVAWALAIVVGVFAMKLLGWERSGTLFADLAAYEAVHIVAHALLYGVLAAGCTRVLGRPKVAVLITLGVGAVQEGVQVLFAGRGVTTAELFDLAVDGTVAAAVAWACSVARPSAMLSTLMSHWPLGGVKRR
jgi:hypothetical protein